MGQHCTQCVAAFLVPQCYWPPGLPPPHSAGPDDPAAGWPLPGHSGRALGGLQLLGSEEDENAAQTAWREHVRVWLGLLENSQAIT